MLKDIARVASSIPLFGDTIATIISLMPLILIITISQGLEYEIEDNLVLLIGGFTIAVWTFYLEEEDVFSITTPIIPIPMWIVGIFMSIAGLVSFGMDGDWKVIIIFLVVVAIIFGIYWYFKEEFDDYDTFESDLKDESDFHQYETIGERETIELRATNSQLPIIKLVEGQDVSLGRAGDNDIVIENNFISSKHVKILFANDTIYVKDMDSTNGTYIEGDKLEPYQPMELREGESLILGSEEVVYGL
ncbi:FHA domain-containing protein [Sulfurovum sp. bin170]|uniref:FHA domain-containing protein n=1 Tax=Sulfurovum sp. bin170 TaxID=2695268 RepID=UPI0013E01315|nr:FHA domain-containing protein [Sulfurovum sp. bin170]NEW60326.1 FHA domain-containing protein [Sulfurovum sp. bin170]